MHWIVILICITGLWVSYVFQNAIGTFAFMSVLMAYVIQAVTCIVRQLKKIRDASL